MKKQTLLASLLLSSSLSAHAALVNLPVDDVLDTSDVNYSNLTANCGGGYTCITDANSLGNGGGGDHFDDAFGVALNGSAYGVSGGDFDGTTLTLDSVMFGNLEMVVEFMSVGPVMRQIVTVTNTGANLEQVNVSWQNNTGNDNSQRTIGTSSGDTVATVEDNWVVTADSDTGTNNEVNAWIFAGTGAGALNPTSVAMNDLSTTFGGAGDQGFSALFDFDLLAGQTSSLMFFVGIEGINQEGLDLAAELGNVTSDLFSSLTRDLSSEERVQIVNFDLVAVPEPGALALVLTGLVLAARRRK